MKKLVAILICFFLVSFSACSWWDTKAYYATHPTQAEDVRRDWGEPLSVEVLGNGVEKWIYSVSGTWLNVEYFFLIREGKVMDFGQN